jgi:predicted SAM-dependent methyltransferase
MLKDINKKFSLKKTLPFFNRAYDSKERFCSYWHQIDEIFKVKPKRFLEVGIGNGFVSKYLKERGINVITLDVIYELVPDICGSVIELPFRKNAFDAVSCYEVLEHLPYNEFINVLKELSRITQKNIILSIPDATTVYRLNIEIPKLKPIKKLIYHPMPRSKRHEYDNEHYWEIGKKGYSLKKIKSEIYALGLNILKTYRIFEYYYHRIFILEKN